jgi:hypothetical protein
MAIGTIAFATLTALVAACQSSSPVGRLNASLDQTLLGTAQTFAVLGGSTVTNTGATTVYGNLGVDPGLAVTGFPPGLVAGGTIHTGDAVALQAQNDTTTAYNTLAGQALTADLTGQDLGGMTLTAGVYHFSSSAQLTGALTLDAQGDPNAVFVFQIGSTLTTASNSSVLVINGAVDCNIFWQVGSSATLGTTTTFKGNILALTSITLNTGALISGRALARNAAVTMDDNDVSILACTSLPDAGGGSQDGAAGDGNDGGGNNGNGDAGNSGNGTDAGGGNNADAGNGNNGNGNDAGGNNNGDAGNNGNGDAGNNGSGDAGNDASTKDCGTSEWP